MNEEQDANSYHSGEEDVVEKRDYDEHDQAIFSAVAWSAAATASENAADVGLGEADLKAFHALGTPDEVADRIMARVEANAAARKSFVSTYGAFVSTNDTEFEPTEEPAQRDAEFTQLLAHHHACHNLEHFEWEYHFVKVMQEIGQGGQGVVYSAKCQDDFVGSLALKIMSPESYPDARSYRQDMERMRSVAAIVHQNYPSNLICVERFAPHDGIYVMFMRLIDGFDLQRLMDPIVIERLRSSVSEWRWGELKDKVFAKLERAHSSLAPGVAVNIIEKCLWGLQALHDKGIVHCDLKPSNIMLDCYGSIRIIDIGSAFKIGSPPRRPSWTPRYAPPEVLEKDEWSKQGDLASLGYVLVEALCGRNVFTVPTLNSTSVHTLGKESRAELAKEKRELFKRLYEIVPAKPRESKCLMELLSNLLAPTPGDRFTSAEQAFNVAAMFRDELAAGGLAMPWVKVTKHWVSDVKRALSRAGFGDVLSHES
jgi:serine/threonine-protein kinase